MHIFGTDIDLNRNQAKNFRLENGIALPSVGASDSGLTFYHSGLSKFYGWTGATWIDLGASGGGSYTLPTASNTTLGGVKIDGTTITIDGSGIISSNPAIIAIDEGNGLGYVPTGRDASLYGNIGLNALDLSQSSGVSTTRGATGDSSFAMGYDVIASSYGSFVSGQLNTSSGAYAMVSGYSNIGAGYSDAVFGTYNTTTGPTSTKGYRFIAGLRNTVDVQLGGCAVGNGHWISSYGTTAVGQASLQTTGSFNSANTPMFVVGNGSFNYNIGVLNVTSRSNALTVLYSGSVIANSLTPALINAEATGRILVTKEWIAAQGFSATPYLVYTAILSQTGTSAPVVTVLRNTIGTITWSYTSTGRYTATSTGAFTASKTIVFVTMDAQSSGANNIIKGNQQDINGVTVETMNSGVLTNGIIEKASIEIRVYP